jgi:hypothetical protein
MIIGLLSLEIFFPYSQSLKDKRRVLSAFRDRIRSRFNVALAELDYQEKWQRALVGVVALNSQKGVVDQVLQKVLHEAERHLEGEITRSEVLYF